MEQEINNRLEALEEKTEQIYVSVEKTRRYFQVVMWVTLALVILPAIGLIFALPAFLNSYGAAYEDLI